MLALLLGAPDTQAAARLFKRQFPRLDPARVLQTLPGAALPFASSPAAVLQ